MGGLRAGNRNSSGGIPLATAAIQQPRAAAAYTRAMTVSRTTPLRCLAIACLMVAAPVVAQQVRVLPVENVRVGYAQVLHVEPVYQTLRANAVEQDCTPATAKAKPTGTLSRITEAVKGAITRDSHKAAATPDCQTTTVQRTFRTPIAYDVDYIYKGMKFRSRLASDPGNMLRVRLSLTPYEATDASE